MKKQMNMTRRNFIKAAGAAGALSALSACSKDSDADIIYGSVGDSGDTTVIAPVNEDIYAGTIGNNCGGKCIVKAHVKNGVIRRFTTDETVESNGDEKLKPQKRACLKCRGKLSEIYKTDRLVYPLRQTKERGDVTGFERISWEQAYKEIADKLKETINKPYTGTDTYFQNNSSKYGKGTVFAPFGGGPVHALASYNFTSRIASCIAGGIPYNSTAQSYPATNYVDKYTNNSTYMMINMGAYQIKVDGLLINEPNAKIDMFNCQHIVLWGFNPADSIMDTNTMYLLLQAKEQGIPITVIDHYVTRTSKLLGAKHLPLTGGTDAALVCAILYHLIHKQLEEANINNGRYLDFNFIKKATHGFFDLPNPQAEDFYSLAVKANPAGYKVAPGTSFSAYILGDERILVDKKLNYAPSVYPETIGYNVNSSENSPTGEADELYDKRVPIYGQVAKTPEWAEMITGIPADEIRKFAEEIATNKKVGIFTGWGSNRTVEGEQAPWAINSLAAVLGCWGAEGRFWGSTHMNSNSYAEIPNARAIIPQLSSDVTIAENTIKSSIINYRRYNNKKLSFANTPKTMQAQIGMWIDSAVNGGSGKSFWNDPAVKYCPPIKTYLMGGGNPVNQCGDNKFSMEKIKEKNGESYKNVDLLVSFDIFMSPSAQYADYVLPCTMPFEMDTFTNTKSAFIGIPKIIDAPGECKTDYEIAEGIMKYYDPKYEKEIIGKKRGKELLQEAFEQANKNAVTNGQESITYEEFIKKGYIEYAETSKETVNSVYASYREYIETNGASGKALMTTSGKLEIFCQAMVEDYEARRWYNFDDNAARYNLADADIELKHIGEVFRDGIPVEGIYTKSCDFTNNADDIPTTPNYDETFTLQQGTETQIKANMKKGRFVYPIPMYIPLIEGLHACDNKSQSDYSEGYPNINEMRHSDPVSLRGEYPFVVSNHHSIIRAHTCADNSPLATEIYKQDGKGNSAFRGESGKDTITSGTGVMPAGELGVYEPLYISEEDAASLSIANGDIILVTSPRASVLMYAKTTKALPKGVTNMGEGAWSSFKNCQIQFADGTSETLEVDVAGSANSLSTQRPSRISQSAGYGTYQRINIRKVTSVSLV